ncbi:CopG family transcriptional regulator [Paenibacillus sp. S-38]|uniref:ribbon-helix-helix domain-containing protein n=1 Tax=Paenibacillus sp. S-38 TaxID=3416710 RepID=UPI003CF2C2D0
MTEFSGNYSMKLGEPERDGQLSMRFIRGGPRRGAGRKGIGETRKVSLTLTSEAWEELDRRCRERGVSRSELLRSMIEAALSPGDSADRREE